MADKSEGFLPQTFDPLLDVDGPIYDLGNGMQTDSPELALEEANRRLTKADGFISGYRNRLHNLADAITKTSMSDESIRKEILEWAKSTGWEAS